MAFRERGVGFSAWAERLRKDDDAAHCCGTFEAEQREILPRRGRHDECGGASKKVRDGFPELCTVSASYSRGKCRVWPETSEGGSKRNPAEGR